MLSLYEITQRKNDSVEYALEITQLPFFPFSCLRLEALTNNDGALQGTLCLSVPAQLMLSLHFVPENLQVDLCYATGKAFPMLIVGWYVREVICCSFKHQILQVLAVS